MANDNPLRRGPETEKEDAEKATQNLLECNINDWPNEAGFEGLTEVRGPVELKVKGHIPSWVAGTLYRTGPGEFNLDDTPKGQFRTTHWFDGFGQSHKFAIIPDTDSTGETKIRVEYSSCRQAKELVERTKKTGTREQSICFGQRRDPCVGIFGKMMTVWQHGPAPREPLIDNVSVTVEANMPTNSLPSSSSSSSPPNIKSTTQGHRGMTTETNNNSLWLMTDSTGLKEVDRQTLEPIGGATQNTLHPSLTGPLSCAHTQRDPVTGDLYNFNLDMGRHPTYRIFRISASNGQTSILATITGSQVKPAYIHSFFLTQSFVVLCVPSSHLGTMGLEVIWQRNIVDAIEPLDPSKSCKWFFIDRTPSQSGVVATRETPPGFFFHSVNAFEEEEDSSLSPSSSSSSSPFLKISCDSILYPTLDVIRSFEMDVLLDHPKSLGFSRFWGSSPDKTRNAQARLTRFLFEGIPNPSFRHQQPSFLSSYLPSFLSSTSPTPSPAKKTLEIPAPHVGELPTINPLYSGKKNYRYVYSLANRGRSTLLDGLVKTDLRTRECVFWDGEEGHTPGEAIFVARPPREEEGEVQEEEEDDGVLLTVVLDGFGKTSYLLVLDARDMRELGRAECEWAVALGFHGCHVGSV